MSDSINNTIHAVRRRVRWALAIETALRLIAAVGLFWWGWMVIDWLLEPPAAVRVVVFAIAAFAGLAWLARHSLSALFAPLPDQTIASWIEQRVPGLRGALLTVVDRRGESDPVHAQLTQASRLHTVEQLRRNPAPAVVALAGLRPWMAAAALAVASVTAWAVLYPQAAHVYASRLMLGEASWPRRVALVVDGFKQSPDGRLVRRVARDSVVQIDAHASLSGGHIAPDEVRATIRRGDGVKARQSLATVGDPTSGPQAQQAYRTTLDGLKHDARLWLRGGDARVGPLHLEVVARPAITSLQFAVTPPPYLGRPPYRQSVEAIDQIPEGSGVTLHGVVSRAVDRVQATTTQANETMTLEVKLGKEGDRFETPLPPSAVGAVVSLVAVDGDGIASEPALRVALRLRRDLPPRVDFALSGIGRTITPDAVIATITGLEDDHSLREAALLLETADAKIRVPLPLQADNRGSAAFQERIDLVTMRSDAAVRLPRLEPGDRLKLTAEAADHYDLAAPHRAESQTVTLEVVSADELVALLEDRERNLRQTFQQVFDEARSAQRLARSIGDSPPAGDDAGAGATDQRLRMARLDERLAKVADETNAVAEGFRSIRDELTNNRIPNDDLRERIDYRIVRPLEKVVNHYLPDVQTALSARDTDAPAGVTPTAQQKLDDLVQQMELALGEMKSVESYNEVLALLRGIIDEQRGLSQKTDDARRASVKRLLLD